MPELQQGLHGEGHEQRRHDREVAVPELRIRPLATAPHLDASLTCQAAGVDPQKERQGRDVGTHLAG